MTGNTRFYIYFHTSNTTNEVFYVGKGYDRRAFRPNGRNNFWHRVANKHGYSVSLPHTGLTESQAFAFEKEYIAKFGRRDLGTGSLVNLTDGGEGASGAVHSEEWKRNMSTKMKGRIFSEEHKRNLTATKIGRKRPEEMKLKLSQARKGIRFSQEHKDKISKAGLGRVVSEETRKKISATNKASSVKKWKPVIQMSLDNKEIATYKSVIEAEESTGANRSVIIRCCKNVPSYNTAGGFKWKYA